MRSVVLVSAAVVGAANLYMGDWPVVAMIAVATWAAVWWRPNYARARTRDERGWLDGLLLYLAIGLAPTALWLLR